MKIVTAVTRKLSLGSTGSRGSQASLDIMEGFDSNIDMTLTNVGTKSRNLGGSRSMNPESIREAGTGSMNRLNFKNAESKGMHTFGSIEKIDTALRRVSTCKADVERKLPDRTIREIHQNLRFPGYDLPDSALARVLFHPHFETFGGCVVLFNFVIMTMETHATAMQDNTVLHLSVVANQILLVYYTAEFGFRLYIMRLRFFCVLWNNLDFAIVATGWLSAVLEILNLGGSGMEQISILKSLRMLRLLRLVRLLVAFRELYVLIAGIGRCMKTLFWAGCLIFMVLNVWAILSVEFLDEKIKELSAAGMFSTCSWCETSFANVWYANLTWFQLVSTGDWTTIGRPLAEEFVWPYTFFVSCIFVVIFGLFNLIVAAIVDANIAAREDDITVAAKIVQQSYQEAWDSFAELCQAMDVDGNGEIEIAEFKEFWASNVHLQRQLTVMGVQERDMERVLQIMDTDGDGTLNYEEFIEQFTHMRTLNEKTTMYFLLKFVDSMHTHVCRQVDAIECLSKEVTELKELRSPAAETCNLSENAPHGNSGKPEGGKRICSDTPDMNKPLPGWYYFGQDLPVEAMSWCKPVWHSLEATPTNIVPLEQPSSRKLGPFSNRCPVNGKEGVTDSPNRNKLTTSSQRWEALPSSSLPIRQSRTLPSQQTPQCGMLHNQTSPQPTPLPEPMFDDCEPGLYLTNA